MFQVSIAPSAVNKHFPGRVGAKIVHLKGKKYIFIKRVIIYNLATYCLPKHSQKFVQENPWPNERFPLTYGHSLIHVLEA